MEDYRLVGKMNITLALSGGAARGAFHLGVLQALDESNINVKAISGSSIGAIVAASYAAGVSPKEQLEIFSSKEFKKIFKFNYFKRGVIRINKGHPLLKKLAPINRLEDMPIPLYIITTDLESGQVIRFSKGDVIPICAASGALVPIFKPVDYLGYKLADGGLMDNLPVEPLFQYNLPILGVNLNPLKTGFKYGIIGATKRSLFLLWRASINEQIKKCDLYITSDKLVKYKLFDLKSLQDGFELGYQTMMEKMPFI